MSDEEQTPPPSPDPDEASFRTFFLLCIAFLPSLVGMVFLRAKTPWLLRELVGLNLVCGIVGSIGLVRRMKYGASRVIAAFLLALLFFILNAMIVLFIGCSGMGRIAP